MNIEQELYKTKLAIKEKGKLQHLRCSNCGEIYDVINGKNGLFLSCPNWKDDELCKATKNIICCDKKYLKT